MADETNRIGLITKLISLAEVCPTKQVVSKEMEEAVVSGGDYVKMETSIAVVARSQGIKKYVDMIDSCQIDEINNSKLTNDDLVQLIRMYESPMQRTWLDIRKSVFNKVMTIRRELAESVGSFFFDKLALQCITAQIAIIHHVRPDMSVAAVTDLVTNSPHNHMLVREANDTYNATKDKVREKKASSDKQPNKDVAMTLMGCGTKTHEACWDWSYNAKR